MAESYWPDSLQIHAALAGERVQLEAMGGNAERPFAIVEARRSGEAVVASVPTIVPHVPAGALLRVRWVVDGAATGWTNVRYHDNRFAWTATSERFVSVWTHPGSAARAQPVLAEAARVVAAYEREFGYALDRPLNIVVYASSREMEPAQDIEARAIRGSANGLAYPAFGVVHVADDARGSGLPLLGHEIAHVITERAARRDLRRLPAWLDEGISTRMQSSAGAEYAGVLREAARAGALLPLAMLQDLPNRASDRALLYASGAGMLDFLATRYGAERVAGVVRALGEGASVEAAFERALGTTLAAAEGEWRASLGVAAAAPLDWRLPLAGAGAALVAILAAAMAWRRRR
jgi:hypothetical protein